MRTEKDEDIITDLGGKNYINYAEFDLVLENLYQKKIVPKNPITTKE